MEYARKRTPQNKLNLNVPKTGDLGTIGFGILGALSLIGLGILNKSKFK
nr:LPXTG cell wall anchor domain-containing protein [Clostridium perfringens]